MIGCGALGLTSALLLQRAGLRVTIYAKDLPPNVRSALATGVWSPDSRICLEQNATPAFKRQWEAMARHSWQTYQTFLGLPGDPVEWIEHYSVRDAAAAATSRDADTRPAFAELESELLSDIEPTSTVYPPGSHPFGARTVHGRPWMMFNLNAYQRLLMSDFLDQRRQDPGHGISHPGGSSARCRRRLSSMPRATALARCLAMRRWCRCADSSRARSRSPSIHYGLAYKDSSFVPRRDGNIFQVFGEDDYYGVGDDSTSPIRRKRGMPSARLRRCSPEQGISCPRRASGAFAESAPLHLGGGEPFGKGG